MYIVTYKLGLDSHLNLKNIAIAAAFLLHSKIVIYYISGKTNKTDKGSAVAEALDQDQRNELDLV